MKIDRNFFVLIFTIQLFATLSIILDLGVFRQLFVFCYLIFVPGYVIARVLKLDKQDFAETFIFSVGLSIAFLYLIGASATFILPAFGFEQFITELPLFIFINIIILILTLFCMPLNQSNFGGYRPVFYIKILALLSIPLLSVLGSFLSVYYQNSAILLLMVALIAFITILSTVKRIFTKEFYPFVIFTMALSFAFMGFYASRFAEIWDSALAFYSFRITDINHFWNPTYLPAVGLQVWKTNSMLSINLLPSIISNLSGISGVLIFKVLYPLVLSVMPLAAYKLYRTQVSSKMSFLAAAFFLANCIGLGWGNDMQKIGQIFYVLLLFVLFKENLTGRVKTILFGLFAFSLVVSHYSMTYILAFTLLLVWLILMFKDKLSKRISATSIILLSVLSFSWYVYVSGGATFTAIQESARYVIEKSSNFLDITSRGTKISQFLGVSEYGADTVYHLLSRFVFQLSTVLIVIGVIYLLLPKNRKILSKEFRLIVFLNLLIVLLNVVLPGLSETLLMQRFYQTTLIVLSPIFVLGGYFIFAYLGRALKVAKTRKIAEAFMLSLVVLLLLFQSGFVYELTGVKSWSVSFSSYRIDKVTLYDSFGLTNEYDVSGATWLGLQMKNNRTVALYCDDNAASGVLLSYGLIDNRLVRALLNTTNSPVAESYIFLRWTNTMVGLTTSGTVTYNTSDIADVLNSQDVIYSNGGAMVYRIPYPAPE